jgi:hypothetical protein
MINTVNTFSSAIDPDLSNNSAAVTFDITNLPVFVVPSVQPIDSNGGSRSATVLRGANCPWTAVSNDPWINVTFATGFGDGVVDYTVQANLGAARTGTVTIAGRTLTVEQAAAPCSFSISPADATFTASGGAGNFDVTTRDDCDWTPVSNASWITIEPGSGGPGNNTIQYQVGVNTTTDPRSGTITVQSLSLTVNQAANNLTNDTDDDGIPDVVEGIEGTNPSLKDNDVFNNARLFAMQQFRDFLGREGDPGGVSFWTGQIQSGAQTRPQAINSFFNSNEFQNTTAPVTRLFFAFFLRIPDFGGLNFWVGQLKAGVPLATISEEFAQSVEFQNRYGSLNNSEFVTLVYNNVLGRAPDPGGLAFWTSQLDNGATRGQVMLAFSESTEFRNSIANEVFVTQIYVGMLRRSPDLGGFNFWVGALDGGAPGLNLITAFFVSAEYHNRFLP